MSRTCIHIYMSSELPELPSCKIRTNCKVGGVKIETVLCTQRLETLLDSFINIRWKRVEKPPRIVISHLWIEFLEKKIGKIYCSMEDTNFHYLHNHYMQRWSRIYLVFSYMFFVFKSYNPWKHNMLITGQSYTCNSIYV